MTKNKNIDKHVRLATSFTEKPELNKIITMCQLKPYDMVFGEQNKSLSLTHRWIDGWGNSLLVKQDKSLEVELNDPLLDRAKLIDNDLYGQLSIDRISSISNFLFFLDGKDEDTLSNHSILAFHGIDNLLRTFACIYGEWCRYPSLFLGIQTLTTIVENLTLGSHKEISISKRVIYPCDSQRVWLSSWPATNDFVSVMSKQNDSVIALLGLHKGK